MRHIFTVQRSYHCVEGAAFTPQSDEFWCGFRDPNSPQNARLLNGDMKRGSPLALALLRPRLASIRSPIDDLLLPRQVLCLNLYRERPPADPSLGEHDWSGRDQKLV
jgi:hypothetical protein